MGDYILLEGNLDEITEYTYNDLDNVYDDAHGNWLFDFKSDHPEVDEDCGLCMIIGNATAEHFKLLHSIYRSHIRRMNEPIFVANKWI